MFRACVLVADRVGKTLFIVHSLSTSSSLSFNNLRKTTPFSTTYPASVQPFVHNIYSVLSSVKNSLSTISTHPTTTFTKLNYLNINNI